VKILFFLDSLELGGAERQALLLAEHLQSEGYEVLIWGLGKPGKVSLLCDEKKIVWESKFFTIQNSIFRDINTLSKMISDIKKISPNIIVPFCTIPSLLCALTWRFTKAHACIWNERDVGIYCSLLNAYSFALKISTCIVTNSAEGKKYIKKYYSNNLDIRVINNGVYISPPNEKKEAWRRRLNATDSTFIGCMVANLSKNKNHILLLQAWNSVLKTSIIPSNSILALAGREDAMAESLRQYVIKHEMQNNVKFLGQVDDISGLLASVDVGILSSFNEGQPNAILEYMYAGLPIIASDIPSIRETLENTNSLFFRNNAVEDLVTALKNIYSDNHRCKTGQNNFEICKQKYLPERMFANYKTLFTEFFLKRRKKISLYIYCTVLIYLARKSISKFKSIIRKSIRRSCQRYIPAIKRYCEYFNANSPFSFKTAKTVPANPKIGFAVLSHERSEYLSICLGSLFESDITGLDITFLIHDDGSTNPKVRSIIEKTYDPKYKIVRFYREKGHNSWGAAFNSAMRELFKVGNFDIVGSCDDDALFHPQWLQKTLPIFLWAKKKHKKHILGPFSPFYSSDAPFHKIMGEYISPYGKYVVKERMGALTHFFFRTDFDLFGVFAEDKDDETIKTAEFIKKKIRNISVYESYVEHIGQDSVLNTWRPSKVARAVYGLNLAPSGWSESLSKVGTLGYFHTVASRSGMYPKKDSSRCLDIIIPAIKKDIDILPLTIQGLKNNLAHPIGNIFIVTPDVNAFEPVWKTQGIHCIDEKDVLPVRKEDISYFPEGNDRSGWLLQQFIKLLGSNIATTPFYFVIDADTVLVRRQIFEENEKTIFLVSDEFHQPYYQIYNRLLGQEASCLVSFVSHMMCFNSERMEELRTCIEKHTGLIWWQAVIQMLDGSQSSGFSEYELYGHWMLTNYPDEIKREYFMNKAISREKKCSNTDLEQLYGGTLRSVSLHSYIN